MTRVLLQPAGGADATKHYRHTIKNGKRLSDISAFVNAQAMAELRALYPGEPLRMWGVTPGHADRNAHKWENLEAGDAVLFAGGGQVFAWSFVKYKMHNRQLALALWGSDKEGQTWEYLYFVSAPHDIRISYARLAKVVGYSADYVILGVTLLNESKSARVLEAFEFIDD